MEFMKMSKLLLNNLFHKPTTNMYPTKPKEYYEGTRGHVGIAIDQCIFCGICSKKCPPHAIYINKLEKEWTIDPMCCIQCNACVESCPKKCLFMECSYTPPDTSKGKRHYHA